MRYLDPLALAQIKNLRLPLRRLAAEGTLGGLHRSVHKGFSQEFAEHREYVPGDEIKFLDWKVYARKDRYFVRQFVEEKSLKTHFLLDASGSMGYRDRGLLSKFEYACHWTLALSYLVLKQKDYVGVATFDAALRKTLAPGESMGHLTLIDDMLAGVRPAGVADFSQALRELSTRLSRRSLVLVFTDLLGSPEAMRKALRALRAQKHEVLVLQVLDPSEMELPWDGQVRVESLEGGAPLSLDAAILREPYRERMSHEGRLNEASFREGEIGYRVLMTDVPWVAALSRFLTGLARSY
jgi:uncharacterized protein (DUF58 family)